VSIDDRAALEDLCAQYEQYRTEALAAREAMEAVTATATSRNALVTVTVGSQGEITSLVFNSQGYRRMAPAELAHTVLETVRAARSSALRQLSQCLPDIGIGDVRVADVVDGSADWASLLPDFAPSGSFETARNRQEGNTWPRG
jgi:DNA-binding protein YbaB